MLCLTTQDSSHQLFPIAFASCSSECEETISFVLNSVTKANKMLFNKDLVVNYFMSDCARYIFTSASQILRPLRGHISCYFHIKECQRKKALTKHKVGKEDRKDILEHLDIMHSMITRNHLEKPLQVGGN